MQKKFLFIFLMLHSIGQAQTLSSSNLPILIINTNNQWIMNEPKIVADIEIKYNNNGQRNYLTDPSYYEAKIGIETRGSSSANFAKQSYGMETLDSNLQETDTAIFNFPRGSDWILSASHSDKTFLRNVLPHHLYRAAGHYSPRGIHVELILNNIYQGVYVLMEKIKRGKSRINIANLKVTDTAGLELTGGYIVKSDKISGGNGQDNFESQFYVNSGNYHYAYLYDDPSSAKIQQVQKDYIKAFVDSAEQALWSSDWLDPIKGYRNYFNVQTFMDYIIVNEFAKNPDTYALSTYFYKPKDNEGRKFCMGPVWDFDLAFKNSYYFNADVDTGFIYPDAYRISLFNRMMSDTSFEQELRCRWKTLRAGEFSENQLLHWVDSFAARLQEGQTRNFILWPVLGQNVYYNSVPYPLTFNDEIDSLKQWLVNRGVWLDAKWISNCALPITQHETASIQLSPNPVLNTLCIEIKGLEAQPYQLTIMSADAKIVYQANGQSAAKSSVMMADVSHLSPAVYFVKAQVGGKQIQKKIIKQ